MGWRSINIITDKIIILIFFAHLALRQVRVHILYGVTHGSTYVVYTTSISLVLNQRNLLYSVEKHHIRDLLELIWFLIIIFRLLIFNPIFIIKPLRRMYSPRFRRRMYSFVRSDIILIPSFSPSLGDLVSLSFLRSEIFRYHISFLHH